MLGSNSVSLKCRDEVIMCKPLGDKHSKITVPSRDHINEKAMVNTIVMTSKSSMSCGVC